MKKFDWTEEMNEVIRKRFHVDGPAKLARELKVSYWTLMAQSFRLGVKRTRPSPVAKNLEWTDEMIKAIKRRYVKEGGNKLAQEFGYRLEAVSKKASELGLHTIAGHARAGKERAQKSTSCNIRYFDTWSPNMAYILGFLFADGSVDSKLTHVSVCMSSKDDVILEFIKKELEWKHEIKRSKRSDGDHSFLNVCSKVLVESVMRIGLKPRKTVNDYPFPEIPEDMMPHFLRGYLDGDGTVCTYVGGKNNWMACSVGFCGSPKFVVGVRDALVQYAGVSQKEVSVKQGKTCKYSSVYWSSKQRDLPRLYKYLYPKGFGFCLERKRKILKKYLNLNKGDR